MSTIFALVDCDAFYCSCEALFHRATASRPAIVLGNNDGRVVARNRLAHALHIKVGTPLFQIRALVERFHVLVYSSNYALYADISRRVVTVLSGFSEHVEQYSIDEVWLDLSHVPPQDLTGYAHWMRTQVEQRTGIPVSVGIASTKTLAKVACELVKTHSRYRGVLNLFEIPETELDAKLARMETEEIWMIGKALARQLKGNGIITARTLKFADHVFLRHLLGIQVQRIVLELRGLSCFPLETRARRRKMISVALSFGRPVECLEELAEAIAHYTARAAEKLRREQGQAGRIAVFLATNPFDPKSPQYARSSEQHLAFPTAFTPQLIQVAKDLLYEIYQPGYPFKRVGVQLSEITREDVLQPDLFGAFDWAEQARQARLMAVVDVVNTFVGRDMLIWGAQGLERSWWMKQARRSPRATTCWNEIPQVE
jgi:DNA polymerase V